MYSFDSSWINHRHRYNTRSRSKYIKLRYGIWKFTCSLLNRLLGLYAAAAAGMSQTIQVSAAAVSFVSISYGFLVSVAFHWYELSQKQLLIEEELFGFFLLIRFSDWSIPCTWYLRSTWTTPHAQNKVRTRNRNQMPHFVVWLCHLLGQRNRPKLHNIYHDTILKIKARPCINNILIYRMFVMLTVHTVCRFNWSRREYPLIAWFYVFQ